MHAPRPTTLVACQKTIQQIQSRRKQRNTILKAVTRDAITSTATFASETVCPVCLIVVRGDGDVVEAHVDVCLAYSMNQVEAQDARDDDDVPLRVTDDVYLTGLGIQTRTLDMPDDDAEIDVEGEGADAAFGGAQFTERDLIDDVAPTRGLPAADGIAEADETVTLRELVATRKAQELEPALAINSTKAVLVSTVDVDKLELAIIAAKRSGDSAMLIKALEDKMAHLVRRLYQ